MSIDEAVGKSLIAPYNITVVETELDNTTKYIKAGKKDRPFFNTETAQYRYLTKVIDSKIVRRETVPTFFYLNRMRFIYNLRSKTEFAKNFIASLEGKTLVFASSIAQSKELCKHVFNSKTDDSMYKAFQEDRINVLGCVNSGGVGHTYKKVVNLVIVQVNSNRKGDVTQKIARSLVLQEGYEANIYIIAAKGTVDEKWKDLVLEDFNVEKIRHVNFKDYG